MLFDEMGTAGKEQIMKIFLNDLDVLDSFIHLYNSTGINVENLYGNIFLLNTNQLKVNVSICLRI